MDEVKKAVGGALVKGGLALLYDAEEFKRLVLEGMDPGTRAYKALSIACDDGLLGPFAEAALGEGSLSLAEACERASLHMQEEYVMDPSLADELSSAIAGACSGFAGLPYEVNGGHGEPTTRSTGPAQRPRGKAPIAWIAPFAACAVTVSCLLVFAHLTPVLGNTFLPARESVDGVECSTYKTRDPYSGSPTRVVFLRNGNANLTKITVQSGSSSRQSGYLEPGDAGILLTEGGDGANGIEATEIAVASQYPAGLRGLAGKLRWRCSSDERGDVTIEIVNLSDSPINLGKKWHMVLARRGAFAAVKCGEEPGVIEPGVNAFSPSTLRDYSYVRGPLEVGDGAELYVEGVLIPHE